MKYLNKAIEYGFYLLVFVLPLQTRWIIRAGQIDNGPWEYGTISLYGTDILLIIVLAWFIIYRLAAGDEKKVSDNKIIWWLNGGLMLATAVSAFFAVNKQLAFYKFGWFALGFGLFWLAISANYNRLKLIYALCAGAFFSAGLGIWQFLNQAALANKWLGLAEHRGADLGASVIEAMGADGIGERWLRAYGSLDHPNILGGFLTIGIFFLIGLIIIRERADDSPSIFNGKTFKFINWLFLSVLTVGLFFSFGRSAWLALAVGLVVMTFFIITRSGLKPQKGLAEAILVMGILLLILFSQYQNLIAVRLSGSSRLENRSSSERLISYQESWQIIKKYWLLGVGPGNYTYALNQTLPGQVSYYYQPAHNVFLLVWSEIGLGGILFFIGIIIFIFARLFNSDRKFGFLGYNMIAVLAALAVIMFFDHWLFSLHFGVLFFWLIFGLAYKQNLDE